jgi:hypothetical protein
MRCLLHTPETRSVSRKMFCYSKMRDMFKRLDSFTSKWKYFFTGNYALLGTKRISFRACKVQASETD